MLKNKIIEKTQIFLFFIVVYLICTRAKNKYDEIAIMILGIITLLKNFYSKKCFKIEKKITYIIFFWLIIMTLSFFKMLIFYPKGDYIFLYRNIMIDNFLLFFILTQMEFEKFISKEKILNLINLLSL